ncbi:MAG: HlyD family efflux transporter periplasmic adaptor subunit [Candidatus Rifleibacteriota bacterium]
MTKNKTRLFAFLLILLATLSGCSEKVDKSSPTYKFKRQTRARELRFRATLKSGNVANISISRGWGEIEWMADEGSVVASGDLVLKINMERLERRAQRYNKNIENQLALFEREKKVNPAEIAQLKKNLKSKKLELEKAINEQKWLKNKKTPDQIWRLEAELKIAKLKKELADKLYELQKKVTDKGFDSPFSLRSSEIDKISREIEYDYARRMIRQLELPPLPEELAQVRFQKEVASGEIWLEQNRLLSASISARIRENNLEVGLERYKSRSRSMTNALEDAVQYASKDGIIVHPVVWGDQKLKPGQRVWAGINILQVITSGDYYLEALVPETNARSLSKNASATIVLDSMPEKKFSGRIKTIGKSPKPVRIEGVEADAFKFLPVEVSVIASGTLLFGSRADVIVHLENREGVFIPRDLLIRKERKNYVLLETAFATKQTEVKVEDFDSDWVLWQDAPEQGVLAYP